MRVKDIIDEDFTNYKVSSMFIALGTCNFKCCTESNLPITICQNQPIAQQKDIEISVDEIFYRYISNSLTSAIAIGGLEPLSMWNDIVDLIKYFREHNCNDVFVIYTGYYENEIEKQINQIKQYKNIIFKFGRFIPNQEKHYDEVLGVYLASNNQYGKVIS